MRKVFVPLDLGYAGLECHPASALADEKPVRCPCFNESQAEDILAMGSNDCIDVWDSREHHLYNCKTD